MRATNKKQCGGGIRTCKTANSKSAQIAFGDLLHEESPKGVPHGAVGGNPSSTFPLGLSQKGSRGALADCPQQARRENFRNSRRCRRWRRPKRAAARAASAPSAAPEIQGDFSRNPHRRCGVWQIARCQSVALKIAFASGCSNTYSRNRWNCSAHTCASLPSPKLR